MCHKFKCRDMKLTYLNTLFRGAWDFTPVVCRQKIRNKAKIYFIKPWSPERCPRFQAMGMVEAVGIWNFWFLEFWDGKLGTYYFFGGVTGFKWGFLWLSKTIWRFCNNFIWYGEYRNTNIEFVMFLFFVLYHFDVYVLEIFKAQKCGMRFLWVNFWSRDSYGFWFLSPFDHPRHLKSRVSPPTPWALTQPTGVPLWGCKNTDFVWEFREGLGSHK